jgi:hypothetical protein
MDALARLWVEVVERERDEAMRGGPGRVDDDLGLKEGVRGVVSELAGQVGLTVSASRASGALRATRRAGSGCEGLSGGASDVRYTGAHSGVRTGTDTNTSTDARRRLDCIWSGCLELTKSQAECVQLVALDRAMFAPLVQGIAA